VILGVENSLTLQPSFLIPLYLYPLISMDPSRDAAGSSEQEVYEALRREELARAQRTAQAQQDSSRPPITLRLPLGPKMEAQAPDDRSQTSIENRMRVLEDLIMKLTMNPKPSTSKESPKPMPLTTETTVYQDTSPKHESLELSRIPVRNKRFAEVLSISSYRLTDRNEQLPFDQSVSLTQVSNQIRPRMEGYYFSGEPPLKVLPFLRHLTRIADQSRISEATLLWIVEDFLQSPARESFRAQAHNTWPGAVHWLLITFAPESSLERAVRTLNLASQASLETVKQFGLRLQLEASTLGSLISLSEVKALLVKVWISRYALYSLLINPPMNWMIPPRCQFWLLVQSYWKLERQMDLPAQSSSLEQVVLYLQALKYMWTRKRRM
jgi:hypothetical protein